MRPLPGPHPRGGTACDPGSRRGCASSRSQQRSPRSCPARPAPTSSTTGTSSLSTWRPTPPRRAPASARPWRCRTSPPASLAIYDTAMAFGGRTEPYHARPVVPDGASFEAAVATAGHDAIVGRLPALAPIVDARYAATLATVPDGQAKLDGIAVGQAVAAELLALRAGDGYGLDRPEYYVAPPPGGRRLGAAGRTRGLPVGRPPGPLRAAGVRPVPQPAAAATEEPALGPRLQRGEGPRRRRLRSNPGADEPGAVLHRPRHAAVEPRRPAARRRRGPRPASPRAALRRGRDRQRRRPDRLLGQQVRVPVVAAGGGDHDDVRRRPIGRTTTDPSWRPLRPTPNFAEHTSGHSCITSASMAVFQRFFGRDRMTFTVTSHPAGESPRPASCTTG